MASLVYLKGDMKLKIVPIILIIFFSIIFIIFFKGLQKTSIYTPNENFEKNVPSFTAKAIKTGVENSSEKLFSGDQFYLMNIWASWCVPCRLEHNFLMKLKANENLKIIGLNYKDKEKNALNFLKELKNPYDKILTDEDGTIAIDWGAYGVPESFLIYNKKIIKKIIGPIDENLYLEIERLIK